MKVFFSLYMGAMSALGSIGYSHAPHSAVSPPPQIPTQLPQRFDEVDHEAKALGDLYRGAGICVVGLGALIVLCAIAPHALESDHHGAQLWGVAEVVLMVMVLVLITWLKISNIRRRWINARHWAESMRYGVLEARIAALSAALDERRGATVLATELHSEVTQILSAQIAYNRSKHTHYEHIEQGGAVIGVAAFALALAAAVAHLVVHWPWLLFLTVAGPTLAGAIHGINGFLRITDMSDDHRDTAQVLSLLNTRLHQNAVPPEHATQLLHVANDLYRAVVARDAQWRGKADTLQPKLG